MGQEMNIVSSDVKIMLAFRKYVAMLIVVVPVRFVLGAVLKCVLMKMLVTRTAVMCGSTGSLSRDA